MGLEEYRRRRNFGRTPEPSGSGKVGGVPAAMGQFVVQEHAARRLHYDFRLELDGVLKSWAVPKGPSLEPGERRMAVETEDHPLEYGAFEGVIPKGEYGGGTVVVWDRGHWLPTGDPHRGLAEGKLDFTLFGDKLRGRWHMVRLHARGGPETGHGHTSWLLIKGNDDEARRGAAAAITEIATRSVLTGRDLDRVAQDADRVWSSSVVDLSAVEGARAAALPASIEPQLATLVDRPPEGDHWIHEIKLDGYRLIGRVHSGKVTLISRNGRDWTDQFPGLVRGLLDLPVSSALLDGEAVVFDPSGRTDFQALQRSFSEARRPDVQFTLFDCLYLDGYDLRAVPLLERKRVLRNLIARAPTVSPLRFGDYVVGRGPEFFELASKAGVEGIVSKQAESCYHPGRHRSWLKVKCLKRQEFLVVGFTNPSGSRQGFGALLLGARDRTGALRYCGRVGTGFNDNMLRMLGTRLGAIVRRTSPVVDAPSMHSVHWVEPVLVAEVSFAEWTRDHIVRHSSFLGLREDKSPSDVWIESPHLIESVRPAPAIRGRARPGVIAGVPMSTPDRIYFPEVGITKRELAQYYEAAAERVLPGLALRPLTLLRCPEGRAGECFYQKRADRTVPAAVSRVVVREGRAPYAMVTDLASLISLVQIGVLELHVWGARADRLDRPDLLVFDLDPDPSVGWNRVVETAQVLRTFLIELGLVPFVRMTGGKGLHVVTPIVRRSTWDQVRAFSLGVAQSLVRLAPDQLTANMAKAVRTDRIFLDTFRNAPESTAVASYSVRARPGAPVAMPITWEELGSSKAPLHLDPRGVLERLASPDPWADFEAARMPITQEAFRRLW